MIRYNLWLSAKLIFTEWWIDMIQFVTLMIFQELSLSICARLLINSYFLTQGFCLSETNSCGLTYFNSARGSSERLGLALSGVQCVYLIYCQSILGFEEDSCSNFETHRRFSRRFRGGGGGGGKTSLESENWIYPLKILDRVSRQSLIILFLSLVLVRMIWQWRLKDDILFWNLILNTALGPFFILKHINWTVVFYFYENSTDCSALSGLNRSMENSLLR